MSGLVSISGMEEKSFQNTAFSFQMLGAVFGGYCPFLNGRWMTADRNPVFANGRGDKIIELKCEYCSAASRCEAFDPLSIGAPFEVFVPRLLSRIIQPG